MHGVESHKRNKGSRYREMVFSQQDQGGVLVEGSDGRGQRPALEVRNLTKMFGGVPALEDFSFTVYPGEINGLIGQNGSGKSTFIKCLAGYHRPDSRWSLEIGDVSLSRPLHPGEVANYGVSFVHQDLGLLPDLTVLENLLLVRFANDHRRFLPWKKEAARFDELLEGFGLDIDLRLPLAALAPVQRAQIAIVRAVHQIGLALNDSSGYRGVLVLDEATTFLDRAGRDSMAQMLRSLSMRGLGVIFVSHDLGEVLATCDRVTVLRDGREVYDSAVEDVSKVELVSMITGDGSDSAAGVSLAAGRPSQRHREVGLRVRGLTSALLHDVSFEVTQGSITALTGIVGGGWEEVLPLIYGARQAVDGEIAIGDRVVKASGQTPRSAIAQGMVYVPANRLAEAIIAELSLEENVTLPQLSRHIRKGFLRGSLLRRVSQELVERFTVKTASVDTPLGSLSGGNQQKAVLAKWFAQDPSIILLAEPTQGVDVGARQRIYEIVRQAADEGATVLYATSDWGEIEGLADTAIVFTNGQVAATLQAGELSVDVVARESYRGSTDSFKLDVDVEALELSLSGARLPEKGERS